MVGGTNIPIVILQARVSSTRLPGKVLKNILGKPMLARQVERLRQAKSLGTIIVATSTEAEDGAIADLCEEIDTPCFRGALDDVLDRFYQCAALQTANHIVRITGDCPLADPEIIDLVVGVHLNGGYEYTSNIITPTWPDGLDVEIMRLKCLEEAHEEATLPSEREHVTPFIYKRPERYRLGSVTDSGDNSALRLTVDKPEDLEKIRAIYEALYPRNPQFTYRDVMSLLAANPDLDKLNSRFQRNEGLRLSERQDRDFTKTS